jgi:redox-sensitive bicupin YhaK (pirin superfamily)
MRGMTLEVRRGDGRFVTHAEGRTTAHSFSFGDHYDPDDVGFGLLVAHNDERLPPGTGYQDHPHADLEIVTVVLSGALRHTSTVGTGLVGPGGVQRLSAGTGVVHAEIADSAEETRFVQTWLRPREAGLTPSYLVGEVGAGGLVAVELGVAADAALLVGDLAAGDRVALPDKPRLHVFVTEGVARIGEVPLGPADAARLTEEGGREVVAVERCRFLVWALGA